MSKWERVTLAAIQSVAASVAFAIWQHSFLAFSGTFIFMMFLFNLSENRQVSP